VGLDGKLSECHLPHNPFHVIARGDATIDYVPRGFRQYLKMLDLGNITGKIDVFSDSHVHDWSKSCTNLVSIIWPQGLISIGEVALHGSGILILDFRTTQLTSIGRLAFYDCARLIELHVPGTLEKIGASCFEGTELAVVDMSQCARLRSLGAEIFAFCVHLFRVMLPTHGFELSCTAFCCSGLKELELWYPPVCPSWWGEFDGSLWTESRLPLDLLTYRAPHAMCDQRPLQEWIGGKGVLHSGAVCIAAVPTRPLAAPL
jgi:hypothetical protein